MNDGRSLLQKPPCLGERGTAAGRPHPGWPGPRPHIRGIENTPIHRNPKTLRLGTGTRSANIRKESVGTSRILDSTVSTAACGERNCGRLSPCRAPCLNHFSAVQSHGCSGPDPAADFRESAFRRGLCEVHQRCHASFTGTAELGGPPGNFAKFGRQEAGQSLAALGPQLVHHLSDHGCCFRQKLLGNFPTKALLAGADSSAVCERVGRQLKPGSPGSSTRQTLTDQGLLPVPILCCFALKPLLQSCSTARCQWLDF